MRGRLLRASWWLPCVLACGGPDDLGWRTHPCPEDARGEAPPFVPLVDGFTEEWTEDEVVATDPVGDASGAFDITRLSATTRGSELYLQLEIDRIINLYEGSASDGTLVLELRLPDGRRLDIDLRRRKAVLGSGGVVPWQALGLVAAPSHAARSFELRFDMSAFDAHIGSFVEVDFGGSDALDAPVLVPLRYAEGEVPSLDDARPPDATLRVASLNTHEAGLFATSRKHPIGRLLRAARADVYCLQELGGATPTEVVQAVEAADPLEDGARWHAHVDGVGTIVGNAVVAQSPLVPIPLGTPRAVAAAVTGERPVVVVSVHLKCCGYQGSEEDLQRLGEVRAIAEAIVRLRQGMLGAALLPYRDAPLVVAGDFNHVGSSDLLADLLSPRTLGLRRLTLPHLAARDVFTWHGYESAFPPATLDLMLHHDLSPISGFVLDSRQLPAERLDALGLWGGDSTASDHLMLVGDFR